MILLYFLFTIFSCFITYKIACFQILKLDKVNSKGYDVPN